MRKFGKYIRKSTYKRKNVKRRRYAKTKPTKSFVSKVRKSMVRLGAVQYFDVAFTSANMAAWAVGTFQDG